MSKEAFLKVFRKLNYTQEVYLMLSRSFDTHFTHSRSNLEAYKLWEIPSYVQRTYVSSWRQHTLKWR